ncbi:transposase, partial [Benzoatithermus flavus]
MAVATDSSREIVGLPIGRAQADAFWSAFLRSLHERGRKGGQRVIAAAPEGLEGACSARPGNGVRGHGMRGTSARGPSASGPWSRPRGAGRLGRPVGTVPAGRPVPPPLAQARRPRGRERARSIAARSRPALPSFPA